VFGSFYYFIVFSLVLLLGGSGSVMGQSSFSLLVFVSNQILVAQGL
jgi:hypothetical protein